MRRGPSLGAEELLELGRAQARPLDHRPFLAGRMGHPETPWLGQAEPAKVDVVGMVLATALWGAGMAFLAA